MEPNLLYVSKTFLFVRFPLLTVLLFVIVVAVIDHRNPQMKSSDYNLDEVLKVRSCKLKKH